MCCSAFACCNCWWYNVPRVLYVRYSVYYTHVYKPCLRQSGTQCCFIITYKMSYLRHNVHAWSKVRENALRLPLRSTSQVVIPKYFFFLKKHTIFELFSFSSFRFILFPFLHVFLSNLLISLPNFCVCVCVTSVFIFLTVAFFSQNIIRFESEISVWYVHFFSLSVNSQICSKYHLCSVFLIHSQLLFHWVLSFQHTHFCFQAILCKTSYFLYIHSLIGHISALFTFLLFFFSNMKTFCRFEPFFAFHILSFLLWKLILSSKDRIHSFRKACLFRCFFSFYLCTYLLDMCSSHERKEHIRNTIHDEKNLIFVLDFYVLCITKRAHKRNNIDS